MSKNRKKHGVSVSGSWIPVPLDFLRSRACAELSPLGLKLLVDVLAQLGPNATRNGDLSITFKSMHVRGWASKSSLLAAVTELMEYGLLAKTRQGSRLDCNLFAVTLYPLNCDLSKLDVAPGTYRSMDYMGVSGKMDAPLGETNPACWRRARKLKTVPPPRDD